nr:immunoglobulin heavy chain junction region [Homo sapiens]
GHLQKPGGPYNDQ